MDGLGQDSSDAVHGLRTRGSGRFTVAARSGRCRGHDGSSIVINIEGDPASGTIGRGGNRLTIVLTTGVEFDFDDDGTDEPATLRLVLERVR